MQMVPPSRRAILALMGDPVGDEEQADDGRDRRRDEQYAALAEMTGSADDDEEDEQTVMQRLARARSAVAGNVARFESDSNGVPDGEPG